MSATANIDEVWSLFKDGCQLIINEEVPSRQSAQRFHQPWANRDVRRISRQKRRWCRRARKTNTQSDWIRYKYIKRRAQLTCRKAHDNHVSSMLSEDHDNPKVFWQYIKSRRKDNFEEGWSHLQQQQAESRHPQRPIYLRFHQRRSVQSTKTAQTSYSQSESNHSHSTRCLQVTSRPQAT